MMGAISVEGVPNDKLDGLATVLFLKPDHIKFKRELNGPCYGTVTHSGKTGVKNKAFHNFIVKY